MKKLIALFVTLSLFTAIYLAPILCIILIKDPHRIVIIYEIVSLCCGGAIVVIKIDDYIHKTLEIKD